LPAPAYDGHGIDNLERAPWTLNFKKLEDSMSLPSDKFPLIDRPDVLEVFSDSISTSFSDGQTFRLEFCITRFDDPHPPKPPSGKKYPVCRLVLTQNALVQTFNQLQNFMKILEQQGIVKKTEIAQVPQTKQ
jgi:hypothetical protein